MMKYYFLSDDRFLLRGLELLLAGTVIAQDAVYVPAGEAGGAFTPAPDDVVLVAVMNTTLRAAFMRTTSLARSKVIMLGKEGLHQRLEGKRSPWVLASATPPKKLIAVLLQARAMKTLPHKVRENTAAILSGLGKGFSPQHVSGRMQLPCKKIYSVTRDIKLQMGLRNCNAASCILICRDMTFISARQAGNRSKYNQAISVNGDIV